MILWPEWTPLHIILTALYALQAFGMAFSEASGFMEMKYSKFFKGDRGLPSRQGMFLLYFVPFLIALGFSLPYLAALTPVQALVLAATLIHFGKRTLEALFLHQYSGKMEFSTNLMILMFYSLVAGGIIYLNNWPVPVVDGFVLTGAVLFVVGVIGNFAHHKLLADLRKNTREYVIPRGGWFEYVACPHYLFEIIGWVGIALMSQYLFTWMSMIAMTGYLTVRSLKTLKWYQQKFADFPKERKALVPFIL